MKTECLETSLKAQTTCAPTDITCICTTKSLMGAIQGCVLSSCTLIEALCKFLDVTEHLRGILTRTAAQNSTEKMCGHPVRDITHITPIVTGVSGGAAMLAVIVRCLLSRNSFGLDDAFVIAAFVSALPMGILEFIMSDDGFGRDIWTIPSAKIYRIVQVL
jgi:hypothetical protein